MVEILEAQQGDVLFYVESKLPQKLQRLDGNVVQEGEHTGHAHRLHGNGFALFEAPDKTKWLKVVEPTALKHEEHKQIELPPGIYRIGIVREYDHFSEEARNVVD